MKPNTAMVKLSRIIKVLIQGKEENDFDQARTQANAEVLYEIMMFMKRFPSLRFNQALACLKIDPEKQFNEEPQVTLARIRNTDLTK